MKRLLTFLVLCLPLYLFAQGFGSFSHDQPFFAKDRGGSLDVPCDLGAWNPALNTNTYAVYDFSCLTLGIGASITSVSNLGPSGYTLTPWAGTPPVATAPYFTNNVSEINNRGYAYFDGSSNSLSTAGTGEVTYNKPCTVFIVTQTFPSAVPMALFDNAYNLNDTGGSGQLFYFNDGAIGYALTGVYGNDTYLGPINQPTNWVVMEVTYNGASSYIKTNNVTAISGTTYSSSYRIGLTLGSRRPQPLMWNAKAKIAWAGVFTNTLNATTSSNIFFYLTNRFDIHP